VVSSSRPAVVIGGAGAIGITINAVAPGLTRTPAAEEGIQREAFEDVRRGQAVPKTLTPGDTVAPGAFLCTEEAAAITGQTLSVDGGFVFHQSPR
jgi:NAD(P)-dependent dehydrogenase (short-subunit alcohol dehydrogenase family)